MADAPPDPPEDIAVFEAHLKKLMGRVVCPICQNQTWQMGGPVAQLTYDEKPGISPAAQIGGRGVFPIVFLMCTTCFYVHQFSWIPLRAAGQKHG